MSDAVANEEAGGGADAARASASAVVEGRRRLLRGGLAAAPVMMTLVSRPVNAGQSGMGGVCTAASSVASINTSGGLDKSFSCTGKSPSTWVNTSTWPAGCHASGSNQTMFNSVFGGNSYPGKSLLDVLKFGSTSGKDGLARYLSAAYLNSCAALVAEAVLSANTTKSIWSSYIHTGWYEPTAGIKWYSDYSQPATNQPAGIIAWVKTTMTS